MGSEPARRITSKYFKRYKQQQRKPVANSYEWESGWSIEVASGVDDGRSAYFAP